MTAEAAARMPMHVIESGPAAGVVGAQAVARRMELGKVITFDMGGTTAKASIIEDGEVNRAPEYQVGGGIMVGSRLLTGAGYLLRVPAIDLAEVGAGGGSTVWIDARGALRVGPRSAGASPGPLCYDLGGTEPTITDANVILGYLNPSHLVGGAVKLNAARAHEVFDERGGPAPRARRGPRRLRRPPHRRLQHDPRDQGRLERARARPARLRALRLRRQRSPLRGGHGPGAGDARLRGALDRGGERRWSRRVYFGPERGWIETPVRVRGDLATPADGPCIVEEYDATRVVPPGATAALDEQGNIVIELRDVPPRKG